MPRFTYQLPVNCEQFLNILRRHSDYIVSKIPHELGGDIVELQITISDHNRYVGLCRACDQVFEYNTCVTLQKGMIDHVNMRHHKNNRRIHISEMISPCSDADSLIFSEKLDEILK